MPVGTFQDVYQVKLTVPNDKDLAYTYFKIHSEYFFFNFPDSQIIIWMTNKLKKKIHVMTGENKRIDDSESARSPSTMYSSSEAPAKQKEVIQFYRRQSFQRYVLKTSWIVSRVKKLSFSTRTLSSLSRTHTHSNFTTQNIICIHIQ